MINHRVLRLVGFTALGCVFAAALWLLYRELRHVDFQEVMRHVRAMESWQVGAACGLTALSYLTLTCYDYFGLQYAGRPLPYRQTAFASFIAYVFSHNVGLSLVGSLAFRYRIYSTFELTAIDVTKVALFCGVTFWLGLLTLGGIMFSGWPPDEIALLHVPGELYRWLGVGFLVAVTLYLGLCARGPRSLKVMRWEFTLPPLRLALTQCAIAALDWVLASTTLYVLLPQTLLVSWGGFLSIFILAAVAVAFAHVPAGLGIIESIMLATFAEANQPGAILGSLLVYRAIYYLAPLALAVVWMGLFEISRATGVLRGATVNARRWFEAVIPRVFSVIVFGTGVVLLLSGVLPAIGERRDWLASALPLAFVEASHLLASITGTALLVVARGLQKRLDGAYVVTCTLLAAGIVFSLAKGIDYEEALILSWALLLLAPCRAFFYRKASLLDQRFSPGWLLGIGLSLLSMLWLGWFANKHVEYRESLWWSFTFTGDAPRSLRAGLAAVVSSLLLGVFYLLRPAKERKAARPCGPAALAIIHQSPRTYAHLALLQDKSILLNDEQTAFIMYANEGRSWIAMGDPVGPASARQDLVWRFRDLVDTYHGWPVFYQVDVDHLPLYIEAGLSLLKIGEEAIVDLASFSLAGRSFKAFRNVQNRLQTEGWEFAVLPVSEVETHLAELSTLSDAWLERKKVREKRFSIGYFHADYLLHFPMAVVRREGRVVCFANLWLTTHKEELSFDLMRFGAEAPPNVMDYLITSLIEWGQRQGYRQLNLGMAPFSGMESRPLAPLWSRLGAKLFAHGERLYNFQGLRDYKDKFAPTWRAKYLASPPGGQLPYILTNLATLINGRTKTRLIAHSSKRRHGL